MPVKGAADDVEETISDSFLSQNSLSGWLMLPIRGSDTEVSKTIRYKRIEATSKTHLVPLTEASYNHFRRDG